jgi:hypothetical protein
MLITTKSRTSGSGSGNGNRSGSRVVRGSTVSSARPKSSGTFRRRTTCCSRVLKLLPTSVLILLLPMLAILQIVFLSLKIGTGKGLGPFSLQTIIPLARHGQPNGNGNSKGTLNVVVSGNSNKNNRSILQATLPQRNNAHPTVIFVGLPHSQVETAFLASFFSCSGLQIAPTNDTPTTYACLQVQYDELPKPATLTSHACQQYDVWTDLARTTANKNNIKNNRFHIPQRFDLDSLHHVHPNATWLLQTGSTEHWVQYMLSQGRVKQWSANSLPMQLILEFAGQNGGISTNAAHAVRQQPDSFFYNFLLLKDILGQIYEGHTEAVKRFVASHPTHRLIQVDTTSNATLGQLSSEFQSLRMESGDVLQSCMVKRNAATKMEDEARVSASPKPPNKRLTFLIPFRDNADDKLSQGKRREENLRDWLHYMRYYLPEALITQSQVVVVEQTQAGVFNKGLLFNAGFDFAVERSTVLNEHTATSNDNVTARVDYLVLHDVDQIPKPDQSAEIYYYVAQPAKLILQTTRQESAEAEELSRKLDAENVGGALMLTPNLFRRINGYSNNFGGWGGEDHNMALRIKKHLGNYKVYKGNFRELYHDRVWGLDVNDQMKSNARQRDDFDSGLSNLNYTLVHVNKWSFEGWNVTRLLVHPEYKPPSLNESAHHDPGNTCDSLFGNTTSMFSLHRGACLQHRRLGWISCRVGNVHLNSSLIHGSLGGEEVKTVMGRSEEEELLKIEPGALEVIGYGNESIDPRNQNFVPILPPGALALDDFKENMNPIVSMLRPSTEIKSVVAPYYNIYDGKTTLLVRRADYANPCLVMVSIYNTYLVLKHFDLLKLVRNSDASSLNDNGAALQIVWQDGHAHGAMDVVWKELFTPNLVHFRQVKETILPNVIVVNTQSAILDAGINAHKWGDRCDATSHLHQFRNFVLERYGIVRKSLPTKDTQDASTPINTANITEKKLMTLLIRKDYTAHPRSNGQTDRKLANVEQDVLYLQNMLGGDFNIDVVSFEGVPFDAQLRQIAKTDVLLSIHGAGNIHVLFLPDHATFVEFFPKGFKDRKRFKYLCDCLGLDYIARPAYVVGSLPDKKVTVSLNPDELAYRKFFVPRSNETNSCQALFGMGIKSDIDIRKSYTLGEFHEGACIQHRLLGWVSCLVDRVDVNVSRIEGSMGGEPVGSVSGRAENLEELQYGIGAFTFFSNKIPVSTFQGGLDRDWAHIVASAAFRNLTTFRTLHHPPTTITFMVRRSEYANPYSALSSMYNVFLTMRHFIPSSINATATSLPRTNRIVWLDGHAEATNLDEVWNRLFGSVVHVKQLKQSQLENVVLVNTVSPFMEKALQKYYRYPGTCDTSSGLFQFRNFVLENYDISRSKPPMEHQKRRVTFLVRKHYRADPRSKGVIDRTLYDLNSDLAYLQAKFGDNYSIHVVSFEEMPFQDALEHMANTDVFVAVHGAGNIHLLFLPDHATFIDYVPAAFNATTRFESLAKCLNLTYMREEAFVVKGGTKDSMTTVTLNLNNLGQSPVHLKNAVKPVLPNRGPNQARHKEHL